MGSTPRVVFWPRVVTPAPERRRLARDSVRGPSRTHRPNITRLARSAGLEELPHPRLHAVGRLDARRPAARDDDVLVAPASGERRDHHQGRRALALVPPIDLAARFGEAAREPFDAHVQIIVREPLTTHVDAGDESDVDELGVAEDVAVELVALTRR